MSQPIPNLGGPQESQTNGTLKSCSSQVVVVNHCSRACLRLGKKLPTALGAKPFSNFTCSSSWALFTESNHWEAFIVNALVLSVP